MKTCWTYCSRSVVANGWTKFHRNKTASTMEMFSPITTFWYSAAQVGAKLEIFERWKSTNYLHVWETNTIICVRKTSSHFDEVTCQNKTFLALQHYLPMTAHIHGIFCFKLFLTTTCVDLLYKAMIYTHTHTYIYICRYIYIYYIHFIIVSGV